jgi:hypothetical protein
MSSALLGNPAMHPKAGLDQGGRGGRCGATKLTQARAGQRDIQLRAAGEAAGVGRNTLHHTLVQPEEEELQPGCTEFGCVSDLGAAWQ